MPTPSEVEFWESRYQKGTTGWDLGQPIPAWAEVTLRHSISPGRTLILGAGRGHDALWFAKQGHSVLAVDFAPSAIADTQRAAATAGQKVETLEEDLFRLDPSTLGLFDVVVEHTCFCAIAPDRRQEYVEVVSRLVKPGGWFLGVFFWKLPPGGPPFATSAEELTTLFSPRFELVRLESNPVSVAQRVGEEGWGAFRRMSY